ncbi:hypothetical protein DFH08DRAFT_952693 [Mycena albidolilacea]|uniref:Uncharacterized protein n=1 Tax=Mycena albidolilacea TaxID=1033008 RepID=A0AAD7EYR1_9AGAR|nr:hypothetical protein DFH08DRAFT_952693 [Mycena albidolilacea]
MCSTIRARARRKEYKNRRPTPNIFSIHTSIRHHPISDMKFFSSLVVLSLGLIAAASPVLSPNTPEVAVRDTVPNASVVPLTLFAVFQTLKEAVVGLTPTLLAIIAASGPAGQLPISSVLASNAPGDMGANDEDLADLIHDVLDDVNTALSKLVPKLGLDGLLTPVDAAVYGLLVSLDASLVPGLLAALQPLLVGLGGVVGGLLAGLNLSGL